MKKRVLRTVDAQTTAEQPDAISRRKLRLHLCGSANYPRTADAEGELGVDGAVAALLEDGWLVETDDDRLRVADEWGEIHA